MLRWARVCWFAAAPACLLGTSVKAFAADPELSPEGEGVRCAADRCEFIERFDFTIRVAPRLDDFTVVAESSRAIPQELGRGRPLTRRPS